MFYDAHLHAGMYPDVTSVLKCALNSSIIPLMVSIHLEECQSVIQQNDESLFKCPLFAGVHPWYAWEHDFDESLFEKLFSSGRISGIGECGLDGKIDYPMSRQLELLERQLDCAIRHSLCVNLHIRSAHSELISLLKRYQGRIRGIIHNFTFSYEIARAYLDLGMYLSIGHHILRTSDKMYDVLNRVDKSALLLETDADYLHTGPYKVDELMAEYRRLSEILALEPDETEQLIESNIKNLLRI